MRSLSCRLALTCAVLGLHAGCSLVFVHPAPPSTPVGAWVDCTESRMFPWGDTIYGAAAVISAVGGTAAQSGSVQTREIAAPLMGVLGAGLLYSAYVGFRRTGRCSDLHDAARAAWSRRGWGQYPQQGYPPPGYPPQPQPQPYPPQPPQPAPAPSQPPAPPAQ